jgi:hypothetical protein
MKKEPLPEPFEPHILPAMRGGLPGWLRVGRERELFALAILQARELSIGTT